MIISPPFLSLAHIPVYDDQCVREVMPGGIVGSGAFPVSQAMAWHGGVHIHPSTNVEPVRAVADGVIVFRRDNRNARDDNEDHSTGCVVIRHATEIGAQGASGVSVTYYSITQHLRQLDATLPAVGHAIYRKDAIGLAGTIYGQSDRIHFEIVAGDADARALIGRATGLLDTSRDGRTDAVFGEVYVRLPAKTSYFSARPTGAAATPSGDTGAEELFIGIRHAGSAELTTYKTNGEALGHLSEPDAEYNLYAEATARHALNPTNGSPSGWYELLRFGRNLSIDPLPANAAHWRKVVVPGQPQGAWVDLNATGTTKFSDADFPHWRGWLLIDDDVTDNDSCCNSAELNAMLASPRKPDADAPPPTLQEKAAERMRNICRSEMQEKLARTICKFPTEWAKDEVRERWAWTRNTGNPYMPYPLEDERDFTEMSNFAQELCFWEDMPEQDRARLGMKHWHFHPREFINQFRKCGWLSSGEINQIVPRHAMRMHQGALLWEEVFPRDVLASTPLLPIHRIPLNRAMRKYGIVSSLRISCFLGNSIQETLWFSRLAELGGATLWYAPWHGRGFLQLTGPANYIDYWRFRGRSVPESLKLSMSTAYNATYAAKPAVRNNSSLQDSKFNDLTVEMKDWRSHIEASSAAGHSENKAAPSDSAGYYWASLKMALYADRPHVLERIQISTNKGLRFYYRSLSFWQTSAAVNLPARIGALNYSGLNGFDGRCVAYGCALAVLTEIKFPDDSAQLTLDFPEASLPRK